MAEHPSKPSLRPAGSGGGIRGTSPDVSREELLAQARAAEDRAGLGASESGGLGAQRTVVRGADDGGAERPGLTSNEGRSRREATLQQLGKKIASQLYMLVRNVKIHAPDNQIFLKPIESLRQDMNSVVALDRRIDVQAADTSIYINRVAVRFDFSELENIQFLTNEFKRRDMGGFSTSHSVTTQDIRNFLQIFAGSMESALRADGEDTAKKSKLLIQRYQKVKELLDKLDAEPQLDQRVDRKKYLMTVYARCVFFMRVYLERLKAHDTSIPFAKAARLVQDLVDLCREERTHFLGMTTTRAETDYLPYHSVNTCLLSIVFGSELGLDRRQLLELGMAALFSQLGLIDVPESTLAEKERLTREQRAQIDLFPLASAKKILSVRGLDKSTMRRIVATYESKVDFAIPRKNETGDLELVMPKMGLGLFGKIIAISETYDALTSKRPFRDSYGPEVGLALMSGEMKYKFDPVLLRIFMKVMAIQPIKVLDPTAGPIRLT
ncbi:MAG: hypothetical protein IPK13_24905 [Deltaproteobacteria bacterium]|nr:hypothetical protein [Deltaproteobacteria bacterium]